MRPKSIDRPAEKRAAVRSVVLNVLLQLITAGALLYLRSVTQTGWLRGLLLVLAAAGLVTIPCSVVVLRQRLEELRRGELDQAKQY